MANIPFLLGKNEFLARMKVVKAQHELFLTGRLIYRTPPLKLSIFQAFIYQTQIREFFDKFVRTFEPLTQIEQAKIEEVQGYNTEIHKIIHVNVRFYSSLLALWSLFRPDYEWFYVHKLNFTYSPSRETLLQRAKMASLFVGVALISKHIATYLGMCFYYPDFLANLQIGEEFEVGYWSRRFVKNLSQGPDDKLPEARDSADVS